jgi:hypothetical protein
MTPELIKSISVAWPCATTIIATPDELNTANHSFENLFW